VNGMDTRDRGQHARIRELVGMVFQNPEDQIVSGVVEEDVAFGLENLGVAPSDIRTRVKEILHRFDLWEFRQHPSHLLSAGQIQRLALAGVLVMQPRCIIFDETTSMLDPLGRQIVMENIDHLHRQGMTIIYITHDMDEVALADRVIVLDHGQVAVDGSPQKVFSDQQNIRRYGLDIPPVSAMSRILMDYIPTLSVQVVNVDQLLDLIPIYSGKLLPHPNREIGFAEKENRDSSYISVKDLGHTYMKNTPLEYRSLWSVNLDAGENEIHALMGATGSGKSTLLQHMNGLYIPQEGKIKIGPYLLGGNAKADVRSLRQYVGMAFQNPDMQIFEQYVGDEIAYGPRQVGLGREQIRENVGQAMEAVGLDFQDYKDRFTMRLSGGERKKVILASALALKPKVLLLDEPFAGLDPQSRRNFSTLLPILISAGMTIIISTHHIEDLAPLVNQVTVLKSGKSVSSGSARKVFGDPDGLITSGLLPPLVTRVSNRLQERSWPIPYGLLSMEELVTAVQKCVEIS
jgi:energy-coupling factor transport system ATP-binding protein